VTGTDRSPVATPRVASGVLFTDRAGRVMLVRPTYTDYWDLPGGYVEPGESPLAASVREVHEELSIYPKISPQPLVIDWAPMDGEGDRILFIFAGTLTNDDLHRIAFTDGELSKFRFIDPIELGVFTPPRLARRIRTAITAKNDGRTVYAEHGDRAPRPT